MSQKVTHCVAGNPKADRRRDMESKAIDRYIIFGTELRYLQDCQPTWETAGDDCVVANIDRFFAHLDEFGLPVSRRAAFGLKAFNQSLKEAEPGHTLTQEKATDLSQMMSKIRDTLMAEANGKVAFIVTDKRVDVNKLLGDVRSLMAPDVFDSLPDIGQYDFTEAGKCIAFERATAGAFHMLRGTESMLRDFYCSIVKRGRVGPPLLWGPMIKHLRTRRGLSADPLLDNLDNIRRSFRNPTQHPEKVYDIQEVQDLWGLCIDVINRMVGLL